MPIELSRAKVKFIDAEGNSAQINTMALESLEDIQQLTEESIANVNAAKASSLGDISDATTQAINALDNAIGEVPLEDADDLRYTIAENATSPTTKAYAVGEYFYYGLTNDNKSDLCRVTKAIASGDTIYKTGANKNCESVTKGIANVVNEEVADVKNTLVNQRNMYLYFTNAQQPSFVPTFNSENAITQMVVTLPNEVLRIYSPSGQIIAYKSRSSLDSREFTVDFGHNLVFDLDTSTVKTIAYGEQGNYVLLLSVSTTISGLLVQYFNQKGFGDIEKIEKNRNLAQIYSSNKNYTIEESTSDTNLYFKLTDMYVRPTNDIIKTYNSMTELATELGVSLVTSPNGVANCLCLSNNNVFVYDLETKTSSFISRNNVTKKHIVILSQSGGRLIYARSDLFQPNIGIKEEYFEIQNATQCYSSNHTYTLEEHPESKIVYFRVPELYIRPSPVILKTYDAFSIFATEINASLVTSPNGVANCIALATEKAVVYDIVSKTSSIINRNAVKKTHVLLLSQVNGYVIYARPDLFAPIRNINNIDRFVNNGSMSFYTKKSNMVDSARYSSTLKLLIFSDIHGSETNINRIVSFANTLGAGKLNAIINCGDTVTSVISDGVTWYDNAVDNCDIDVLTCVGNHDEWSNMQTETEADMSVVYNAEIAPVVENVANIVQPENASTNSLCYYYKDYGNFRIIVLDAMRGHISNRHYDADQNTWFTSVLADAITNSKAVICVNHAPYNKTDTNLQLVSDIGGWNCWADYSDADGVYIDDSALSAVDGFISNGGVFVGWLTGHRHRDYIVKNSSHPGQTMFVISTANKSLHNLEGATTSDISSELYDCFNYMCFDETHKFIKIWRVGYNIDGALKHKNTLCYDYVNNTVISHT